MTKKNAFPRTDWSRRDILQLSTLGLAALAFGRRAHGAGESIPISVQLYSVRNDCAQDFDKALERVAKMGFQGVEFAGYHTYNGKPKELKQRLADLGLKAAGTHIGTGQLEGDNLQRTIDFHAEIGCKFLIVPGDGDFTNPDKHKQFAERLSKAAAALKPHDMYCGYHNHTHEFSKLDGKTYWDHFAENTTKDVVLQQDVGWTTHAGVDPVELIRKYPGRSRIIHFKPDVPEGVEGKTPIIGQDAVNWKGIIEACYDVGATEWFTIEQEWYPQGVSPMAATEMSLVGLKKILADMGK